MRDIARSATAVGLGTLCALALSLPVSADGRATTVEPSETIPAPSESAPPDTMAPDSTPDSTAPAPTLVVADEPGDEIDTTLTAITVTGFVLLLAVASWWMVRRKDPDAQSMPPVSSAPPSDLV